MSNPIFSLPIMLFFFACFSLGSSGCRSFKKSNDIDAALGEVSIDKKLNALNLQKKNEIEFKKKLRSFSSEFFDETDPPEDWIRFGRLSPRISNGVDDVILFDKKLLLARSSHIEVRERQNKILKTVVLDAIRAPALFDRNGLVVGAWQGELRWVNEYNKVVFRLKTPLTQIQKLERMGEYGYVIGHIEMSKNELSLVRFRWPKVLVLQDRKVKNRDAQLEVILEADDFFRCGGDNFSYLEKKELKILNVTSAHHEEKIAISVGTIVDVKCRNQMIYWLEKKEKRGIWQQVDLKTGIQISEFILPEVPHKLLLLNDEYGLWASTKGHVFQLNKGISKIVFSPAYSASANIKWSLFKNKLAVVHDDTVYELSVFYDENKKRLLLEENKSIGHKDRVTDMYFDQENNLWSTASDGRVRIWSIEGEHLFSFSPPAELGGLWKVRLSSDKKHVLVLSSPRTLSYFRVNSNEKTASLLWKRRMNVPDYSLADISFSPDGSRIFALTGREVHVLDAYSGSPLVVKSGVKTPFNPKSGVTLVPVSNESLFLKLDPERKCHGPSLWNVFDESCQLLPRKTAFARWYATSPASKQIWLAGPKSNGLLLLPRMLLNKNKVTVFAEGSGEHQTGFEFQERIWPVQESVQKILPVNEEFAVFITRKAIYGVLADGRRTFKKRMPFSIRVRAAAITADGKWLALAADQGGASREERALFRRLVHLIPLPNVAYSSVSSGVQSTGGSHLRRIMR